VGGKARFFYKKILPVERYISEALALTEGGDFFKKTGGKRSEDLADLRGISCLIGGMRKENDNCIA
jgi:hypothetical protein